MDKIIEQIMDSNRWPSIQLPNNLELLNEIADSMYAQNTFEGMLAATLMYHQIIEAMCMHLLEDCHFFIQLSVYPSEIQFNLPTNKMFGYYINDLKSSISFTYKKEFIKKAEKFNFYRIDAVHKMRKSNLDSLKVELSLVKTLFDEIYNIYDTIQDNFRVDFHGFKKDVFIDYLTEEEQEKYL